MNATAGDTHPTSGDDLQTATSSSTGQTEVAESGPNGYRLYLTSIFVFSCVVMFGAVIGMIVGQTGGADLPSTLTAASADRAALIVPVGDAAPTPTTTAAPTTNTVPTTNAAPASDASEVLGIVVTEPVEMLELPKAVYDRFTLEVGDSLAINIAANDKIGGDLESVELTGLGELAPGFSLEQDGSLLGTASECGRWRVQYALNSTNPATGTSWVDLTVVGCNNG